MFDISSVAALPGGDVLAVLDDGLRRAKLVRIAADGGQQVVAGVNTPARIHVATDGRVLVTQPDLCDTRYLSFDLYALRDDALVQLTHCAHLRRAVHAGSGFVALQLEAGTTQLVTLDADGGNLRVLYSPPAGTDLIDLAADGAVVSFISRTAGDWKLVQLDPSNPGDMRTRAQRRRADDRIAAGRSRPGGNPGRGWRIQCMAPGRREPGAPDADAYRGHRARRQCRRRQPRHGEHRARWLRTAAPVRGQWPAKHSGGRRRRRWPLRLLSDCTAGRGRSLQRLAFAVSALVVAVAGGGPGPHRGQCFHRRRRCAGLAPLCSHAGLGDLAARR